MKKHILSTATALLFTLLAFAQSTITGRVLDAETKQPLEGASVFAQNTTIGAVTKADGSFKLSISRGGYELVISFTGYNSERLTVDASADQNIDIELKKEDKSLGEVVVKSSSEVTDGWEKYGAFFIQHFIGATPNAAQTVLQNPEALKFFYYKRTDRLKVMATEPLRITNNALGYTLQYALDSFVYHYKTDVNSYRGNCFYLPMEGDSMQQRVWDSARLATYQGSRMHFLHAYYDSTIKQQGFTIDMLSSSNRNQFLRLSNPYDTSYYFVDDSTGDIEMWYPDRISITYTKAKPESEYLQQMKLPKDVPVQISYVDLKDAILIKENGYFLDQRSWINQGYWSWKNLADQLPYDYKPK
jgi:CarboxypepD_reg-like domain